MPKPKSKPKSAPVEPLKPEEAAKLRDHLQAAAESNIKLVDFGMQVQCLRGQLASAEAALRSELKFNSGIHSVIAPLLHRLPIMS